MNEMAHQVADVLTDRLGSAPILGPCPDGLAVVGVQMDFHRVELEGAGVWKCVEPAYCCLMMAFAAKRSGVSPWAPTWFLDVKDGLLYVSIVTEPDVMKVASAISGEPRKPVVPVMYDATTDRIRPVTQEDWNRAADFMRAFGRLTSAVRDFHAVVEEVRLASYPGAIPRPLADGAERLRAEPSRQPPELSR